MNVTPFGESLTMLVDFLTQPYRMVLKFKALAREQPIPNNDR
jgi:hypothetical protein